MTKNVVILGAGQAGFQTASSLRDNGFEGSITLIGNEATLPYERPPLSKSYLTGEKDRESLQLRSEDFFAARRIELLLNEHAIELDRRSRKVVLRSGKRRPYDHLVLATGASNRELPFGSGLDGVFYLRTLAEADRIRERLFQASEVVVVGAGFIGLELAAVLAKLRKKVVVLDIMPRVMSRAVSSVTAEFFANVHSSWGTTIVTEAKICGFIESRGKVTSVKTAAGVTFPADLVLVGIGVKANTELAAAANLPVHSGIVVDAQLRTVDPDISAIGDCAEFPSCFAEDPVRLESVQNAVDQARCVASRLVGRAKDYTSVPWFWSDQATVRLQIVGITATYDRTILHGDLFGGKFSVFCFKNGKLIGIESINAPADHMLGRKLMSARQILTVQQATEADFNLKTHLARVDEKSLGHRP